MAYERSADVLVVMLVRNKLGLQEEEQCRAELCEGKRAVNRKEEARRARELATGALF